MFQQKNASFWKISLLLYTICIIFLMFFAFGRQSGSPDAARRYSFVITGIPLWMPRHFSLLWVFSMGNLLAFAPFGLLLPRAFPTRLHSYSRCLAVFAAAVIALELMQMLTRNDQGAGLQRAVQSATKGDTSQIVRLVQQLMQSPDGAELVERINKAVSK